MPECTIESSSSLLPIAGIVLLIIMGVVCHRSKNTAEEFNAASDSQPTGQTSTPNND